MDELMDTLMQDDISASDASDKIKDILFAKSAERINAIKRNVANSLFDQDVEPDSDEEDSDVSVDAEAESDNEVEAEVEKAAAVISGEDRSSPES